MNDHSLKEFSDYLVDLLATNEDLNGRNYAHQLLLKPPKAVSTPEKLKEKTKASGSTRK